MYDGLMRRRSKKMSPCANCNHWKLHVIVRFCSMCGKIVNENVPIKRCTEEKHAKMLRQRNMYCVDCGKQLG